MPICFLRVNCVEDTFRGVHIAADYTPPALTYSVQNPVPIHFRMVFVSPAIVARTVGLHVVQECSLLPTVVRRRRRPALFPTPIHTTSTSVIARPGVESLLSFEARGGSHDPYCTKRYVVDLRHSKASTLVGEGRLRASPLPAVSDHVRSTYAPQARCTPISYQLCRLRIGQDSKKYWVSRYTRNPFVCMIVPTCKATDDGFDGLVVTLAVTSACRMIAVGAESSGHRWPKHAQRYIVSTWCEY